MTLVQPPRWSADQLEADRTVAIRRFRRQRMEEPLEAYSRRFEHVRVHVERLLERTADFGRIETCALDVTTDAGMLRALRYVAGPPMSEDDLEIVADATSLTASRLRADPDTASRIVEAAMIGLDRHRFPWYGESRDPTPEERETAIVATACLIATQEAQTARRTESKETQEQQVSTALVESARLRRVAERATRTFSDAPAPGEFCGESLFGERKADLVVRLWDGRCMPIECKVSNSSTNSVKRLNNDAAAKAHDWIQQFGSAQTVPAAVLSGVFKRHNLEQAQDRQLTLFWAHDLGKLIEFVEATRS